MARTEIGRTLDPPERARRHLCRASDPAPPPLRRPGPARPAGVAKGHPGRVGVLLVAVLVLVAGVLPPWAARAQLDEITIDDVAAATVLLTALITHTENGVSSDDRFCALGSGSMVSPDGLILTNSHVVSALDTASSLAEAEQIALNEDGRQVDRNASLVVWVVDHALDFPDREYTADVVLNEPGLDLAVLRITGDSPGFPHRRPINRPYLQLGGPGTVGAGAEVHIFGYPLPPPASEEDRICPPVPSGNTVSQFSGRVSGFESQGQIRVDATASSGNSGGATVDDQGRLIGVPTLVDQPLTGGLVVVIPVDRAREVLAEVDPNRFGEELTPSALPTGTATPESSPTQTPTATATPPAEGVVVINVWAAGAPVAGACVALRGMAGTYEVCDGDAELDLSSADGQIELYPVLVGDYTAEVTSLPPGTAPITGQVSVTVQANSPSEVVLGDPSTPTATATPEPMDTLPLGPIETAVPTEEPAPSGDLGTVRVVARDQDGNALAGGCYAGSNEVGPYGPECDGDEGPEDGVVEFTDLGPGEQEISAVSPPPGYELVGNPDQTFDVGGGETETVVFEYVSVEEEPETGAFVLIVEDQNEDPATGSCFRFTPIAGTPGVPTQVCDADDGEDDGTVTAVLPEGPYLVEDAVPPAGAELLGSSEIEIVAGETEQQVVQYIIEAPEPEVTTGELTILAEDEEGNPVPGGCYTVTSDEGTFGPFCDDDANGRIVLTQVTAGENTAVQVSPPEGELGTAELTEQTVDVEAGEDETVTFVYAAPLPDDADRDVYESPTYGFTLAFDPEEWEILEELSEPDGSYEGVRLSNDTSEVTVQASDVDGGDHVACLDGWVEDLEDNEGYDDFAPLEDEDGEPIAQVDGESARAAFSFTESEHDRVWDITCRVLIEGEATLAIALETDDGTYEEQSEALDRLLDGLDIPDVGAEEPVNGGSPPTGTLEIEMVEVEGSGISGTAVLTDEGGAVIVSIAVSGDGVVGDHPVHIHQGTCDNLDPAPEYPLADIDEDGLSETTIEGVTLAELAESAYAINAHLSAEEIGVYVTCGDITVQ